MITCIAFGWNRFNLKNLENDIGGWRGPECHNSLFARSDFCFFLGVLILLCFSGSALSEDVRNPFRRVKPPEPVVAPLPPVIVEQPVCEQPALSPIKDEAEADPADLREAYIDHILSKTAYLGAINGRNMYRDETGKCYIFTMRNGEIDDSVCYREMVSRLNNESGGSDIKKKLSENIKNKEISNLLVSSLKKKENGLFFVPGN